MSASRESPGRPPAKARQAALFDEGSQRPARPPQAKTGPPPFGGGDARHDRARERAAAPNMESVRLERYRAETDEVRTRNEVTRMRAAADIREQDVRRAAEIVERDQRTSAEVKAIESNTETTRRERYFFMGMTAFGLLLTVTMSIVAVALGDPVLVPGTAPGVLAFGTGLRRLRVLSPAGGA